MNTKELRHSMILHLKIAGAVTESIGMIALKLIDVIDGDNEEQSQKEMDAIACVLIKDLCNSIANRQRSTFDIYLCGRLEKLHAADLTLSTKNEYLKLLSDMISTYGGESPLWITNSAGDKV
jgi:hypothetical protein